MTRDEAFFARYSAYLRAGFPSDEAMVLAEGRWAEWSAPEVKDQREERDGTYR